jgi:hypothetical protein
MAARKLSVVAGDLSRKRKPRTDQPQSEIARRWRTGEFEVPAAAREKHTGDVIPLLDGWIRRLERQVGLDPAANES